MRQYRSWVFPMTMSDRAKKEKEGKEFLKTMSDRERKEKERGLLLLREQMRVEGKLVGLYEKTASEIKSKPVRHLLHMIQLDSRKHIDICETAMAILMGEDVLKEEKQELLEGA